MLGILGVRTIGYCIDAAGSELRLDTATFLLIGVAGLSMMADALSRGLRRNLRVDTLSTRLSADRAPGSLLAR
jgi:phosphonate transport system permease protein